MMTRFAALLAVPAFLLAGCSESSQPTAPDQNTQVLTFTASLSPANEVPPITNAEAGGSGNVTITLRILKDANGTASSASIDFVATFSGFPAGTALTSAHIHPGAAGANGGVLVSSTITSGEITMPAGSGTLTKQFLSLTIDQANALVANPGGHYFNIHTALSPGGVARGQLRAS